MEKKIRGLELDLEVSKMDRHMVGREATKISLSSGGDESIGFQVYIDTQLALRSQIAEVVVML